MNVSKTGNYILACVLAAVIILPLPFERIPYFEFVVIDETGKPLPDVPVIQEVRDYTFNSHERYESSSDGAGRVVFPRRVIWGSVAYRVLRPVVAVVLLLAHGSTSASADMYVGR